METTEQKAYTKLHLSILISSFTSILGRVITLNEGLLVWYRLLISFFVLFVAALIAGKHIRTSRIKFLKLLGTGAVMALHWVFFYGSIKYANVSIGIVCFSLVSLFTALIEPFVNHHRIFKHELLFSLITLGGILLIFHFDSRYQVGIILGIISSFLAALYTIFNKKICVGQSSSVMLLWELLGGAVLLTLLMPFYLYFFPVNSIIPDIHDVFYLILLSVFCTVGLYILQIQSLRVIAPFTVNLTYNLEPVYTIILAMLIFHENKDLNFAFYIGMGLIFFAVVLQSIFTSKGKAAKS